MLPSANDLRCFIEVGKTLNLSRAAERLGMTQPALSQGMKRLEHAFGQSLFIRSKTGVTLTKSGQKLSLKAKYLLDEWEKIKDDVRRDEEEIRGRYSLGFHPSVALYTVDLFLPQLLKKYPEMELRLKHDLSRNICEDIISYKLDFGLVINPVHHPDLVIKDLFKDQISFWRSTKKTETNQYGDESSVLIFNPELLQVQDLLAKLSKRKIQFDREITSNNLEVIRALTVNGAGVGILPTRVAKNGVGKLVKADASFPYFSDQLCLVYRVDSQKSAAAKTILNYLSHNLKEG